MKAIDQLICVSKSLNNQCIDNAKKSGKKVVGYICSYAPEKIIHAAGTVPYRLRAIESNSTGLADAYFSSLNCSFARHVFNNALSGKLKFLDGAVFMNSCDRSRRIYDN
jgi:benzoyl-CoA reductase/2-hydroxyglutaryl-CoA dehydratase subunit BcrC/BadD/HgdB